MATKFVRRYKWTITVCCLVAAASAAMVVVWHQPWWKALAPPLAATGLILNEGRKLEKRDKPVLIYDSFRQVNVCRSCWAFHCSHENYIKCGVPGCECTTGRNPVSL